MQSSDERVPSQAAGRFRWHKLWPLGLIAAAAAAFYLAGLHEYFSLHAIIRERVALAQYVDDNLVLAVAGFVLLYAAAVAVSFPGASILTVLAGFLFGTIAGTAITVVAATLGATVIFLAAKTSLGETLRARVGGWAARFADGFEENAFSYLLFLRLVPLFPFWVINIVPAMFAVSVPAYVAATALGIIPGTFAYAFVGSGLSGLIDAQETANPGCAEAGSCEISLGALFTPQIIAAFVALAVVALIPIAVKTLRRRRAAA